MPTDEAFPWLHREWRRAPILWLGLQLQAIVRGLPFDRVVNRHGFVSIQRFCIYTEPGLAKQRVTVWIMEGRLQVEYRQALLARYDCTFDRKRKRLKAVSHPKLYRTLFQPNSSFLNSTMPTGVGSGNGRLPHAPAGPALRPTNNWHLLAGQGLSSSSHGSWGPAQAVRGADTFLRRVIND